MTKGRILMPKTWMLTKGLPLEKQLTDVEFPLVLKQPDGSFSKDMFKVKSIKELKEKVGIMYGTSELIVAQQFIKSEFDWRIGVLDGKALFASKYYMAPDHWQIYNWDNEDKEKLHTGDFETLPIDQVPNEVISTAVKAAGLIGDGLYGVDLKEVGGKVYLIEINDNPNFDYGIEDKVLGNELYKRIMRSVFSRIEKQRGLPKYVSGD
jgi:glutathione synthase/RimK-type ligase-like ATP-grasp enzyme